MVMLLGVFGVMAIPSFTFADSMDRSPAVLPPSVDNDDSAFENYESYDLYDVEDEETIAQPPAEDEIKISSAKNNTSPYLIWSDIPEPDESRLQDIHRGGEGQDRD